MNTIGLLVLTVTLLQVRCLALKYHNVLIQDQTLITYIHSSYCILMDCAIKVKLISDQYLRYVLFSSDT